MKFNHGSLFSGIGGFDLAAEWMGWENKFHCEIDPFNQTLLKHYWPNAKTYSNIKDADFTFWKNRIDILTGGFPCQPFSQSGKREGTNDDRHLWPQMLRAIREIEPTYIVGENVFGIINWNEGMVFEQVHVDLENEGYEVRAVILPACSVDAPHERYRTWFVANSNKGLLQAKMEETLDDKTIHRKTPNRFDSYNTLSKKIPFRDVGDIRERDGFPQGVDVESIPFTKWWENTIQGYGNAIVPQLAMNIFKAIEKTHLQHLQSL